jgi:ATP/maltotriose-dependent transcriptional regulator MalT
MHIESYLAEDVMNTWAGEYLEFIEKISVCDKLCGPLCQAIAGQHGSRLLQDLYDQNSFLMALDEEHTWFRFHHLFLDFLRKRLNKKNISFLQDLHCRAGEWFMANNYYGEAVDHFLQGAHYEAAIALMEKLIFPMIFQGVYSNGHSWLHIIPDRYRENSLPALFFEMYYYASIAL